MNPLYSEQDASVNFILPYAGSYLEARYVRREADYFICYLSSHNGCNKSCRFCHLTQTGQIAFDETELKSYLDQAELVFAHYVKQAPAQRVNFNFMARGEPLANSLILTQSNVLFSALSAIAERHQLKASFNLSSILPEEVRNLNFTEVFTGIQPVIYYSLYSTDLSFRKRWLPKALEVETALNKLATWQKETGGQVVLHWAMIENENDSDSTIESILAQVANAGLEAKFNLVRYNPYSSAQGKESPETTLNRQFQKISLFLKKPESRIVPKVGFDVFASCGMFYSDQDAN